jgi:hypothetical protein
MRNPARPMPLIQTGSTSRTDLQPSPIDPDWITGGNPTARALTLALAEDNNYSCGLWDCTAGEFKYIYYTDEIVHILEGEVYVREDGAEHHLGAGDTAFFPKGLTAHWTVPNYVKKFAIHRVVPRPLTARIWSRIKKMIRKILFFRE